LLLRFASLAGLLLLATACAAPPAKPRTEVAFVTVASQPANVGDAKIAALAYHDSGQYARDLVTVADQAAEWIRDRAGSAAKPALVLDVDETSLSNWEVLKRDDFGRPVPGPCAPALDTPCGWAAWDLLGRDPAIEPTLRVFNLARSLNVTVFFITGRPESQRSATEGNLVNVGYGGFARLYLVPEGAHFAGAADFKAPIRAQIEQAGYTIIANMGDQPSDLIGGHAEKMFLLPDPFYRVP
jgi:predicted secreted acid phosphatase